MAQWPPCSGPGINYTAGLTQHVMRQAAESEIVRQQIEKPDVNVFTGDPFGQESEEGRLGLEEMFSVDEAALETLFGGSRQPGRGNGRPV